jgi:hypothetical protein
MHSSTSFRMSAKKRHSSSPDRRAGIPTIVYCKPGSSNPIAEVSLPFLCSLYTEGKVDIRGIVANGPPLITSARTAKWLLSALNLAYLPVGVGAFHAKHNPNPDFTDAFNKLTSNLRVLRADFFAQIAASRHGEATKWWEANVAYTNAGDPRVLRDEHVFRKDLFGGAFLLARELRSCEPRSMAIIVCSQMTDLAQFLQGPTSNRELFRSKVHHIVVQGGVILNKLGGSVARDKVREDFSSYVHNVNAHPYDIAGFGPGAARPHRGEQPP